MILNSKSNLQVSGLQPIVLFLLIAILTGSASADVSSQNINEEGAFLVYRRQSLIGKETYSIRTNQDSIIVNSLQGENERGRITGVQAVLHLKTDFSPLHYFSRRLTSNDTTNIFKIDINPNGVTIWEEDRDVVKQETPSVFFPLHSNIPAAMEMMLYQYYLKKGQKQLPTLPRGEITMTHKGRDIVKIKGADVPLDRYVVEGINWGGRTVWLDQNKNLVALVKANTQIRELIKEGYEEALPYFIAGNVEEQISALTKYTEDNKGEQSNTKVFIGCNLIDGLSDVARENMILVIENGIITAIGKKGDFDIPRDAQVFNMNGKTLMPGLWDMHAHSNQVQWAPAYLAGGITTIRDNGNEIEFATAFRDAIAKDGSLGPDILLAGMTDGPGKQGNGIIRARTPEEAREVVEMYYSKGYKQIKIYTSVAPDIVPILAEEAHKRGITTTGHVPREVGNAIPAIESGMDMLSHRSRILTVLFPDKSGPDFGRNYLSQNEVSIEQIKTATDFLLKHGTVLDPTIALDVVRAVQRGVPIETVEPDAGRIAYELWEGKRFRSGGNEERSKMAVADYTKAMEILGDFYRAGVPIVAGTDNIVPVFSLYLEIETYQKLGKLTPLEAIRTATIIPAKAMGLDSKTGTLEVGKEADIAILNKNPLEDIHNIRSVFAVVTNGNYYLSDPLWKAADFQPAGN